MSKEPNDNREEDLEEETDTTEGEDESSSGAEEEEAEDGEEADPEEGADEGEEDEEGEDDEEEGEEGEDDEEEDEDYDPKLDPSGKFKGKSKVEILKSYRNLERNIGVKAQELAQELLKKNGKKAKVESEDVEEAEEEGEFDLGLTDEQISKMKPGEFGKVLSRKILEKATEIATNTMNRTNEVRGNVQREIRETTKEYPQLKENPGFRKIVIALIQSAAARDEVLSLKDACKEAVEATGIKVAKKKEGEEELGEDGKPKKKKNRMAVEKPGGSDGKPVKSDADRVREGLMGGRSSTDSILGGMGV